MTIEPVDERWRWYEEPVSPWAFFDGNRSPQVTEPDSFYNWYRDMIDGARAQPTVLEMWLDSAVTAIEPPVVRVGIHLFPQDTAADRMENLVLVAVLFEDSIPYESGIHQGDTAYARMVVRNVIADTWGIPVTLEYGVEFDTTFEAALGDWRQDKLGVAAFVQDTATKQVLQSVVKYRLSD